MTSNQCELLEGVAAALCTISDLVDDPKEFQAALTGIIATVVGNIPEDRWQKFIKVEPCWTPGCDCHLTLQPHGIELFKLLREEYLRCGPAQQFGEA